LPFIIRRRFFPGWRRGADRSTRNQVFSIAQETPPTPALKLKKKFWLLYPGTAAKGKSPLCGNTIWQDRRFLIKYMPTLEAFCHYRNIDVSSIKELVKRWYPALPAYKKKKAHLALSDIKESINELKYYRDKVFIPR
jgi:hypothetical protein